MENAFQFKRNELFITTNLYLKSISGTQWLTVSMFDRTKLIFHLKSCTVSSLNCQIFLIVLYRLDYWIRSKSTLFSLQTTWRDIRVMDTHTVWCAEHQTDYELAHHIFKWPLQFDFKLITSIYRPAEHFYL